MYFPKTCWGAPYILQAIINQMAIMRNLILELTTGPEEIYNYFKSSARALFGKYALAFVFIDHGHFPSDAESFLGDFD